MIKKIFNSLKKAILREEHIEIGYDNLSDFLLEKKEAIEIEIFSKAKKELPLLNDIIKEFNSKILTLSMKRFVDSEMSSDIVEKLKDSISRYVSLSRSLLKKFSFLEDESGKLVEISENSNELIKEYLRDISGVKDFLVEHLPSEVEECENSFLKLSTKLSELSKELSSYKIKEISKLEELAKMIVDIEDKKVELTDKKKKMDENLTRINELKEKNLAKIEEYKQSPEFSKFHEMIQKRKVVMDKLSEHRELFEHDFQKLKPVIVYYQSKYFKNVFQKYFDDPYSAFLEDEGEKFLMALPDLKEKVNSGEINLDDEKKRAFFKTVDTLTKDNFIARLEDYKSLKEQKFRCERIMSSSNIMNDYTETEYKLEHINTKLRDQRDVLKNVIHSLSGLDSSKFVSDAEERINQLFGGRNIIFRIVKENVKEN